MERRYELDNLRSLAMLSPGAKALRREDAIDLVVELEDTQGRLRRLIAEHRRVADEARHPVGMVPDVEPMLADRGLPPGDLGCWAVEPKLDGSPGLWKCPITGARSLPDTRSRL